MKRLAFVACVAALVLAGCGSDIDTAPSTDTTPAPSTYTTDTTDAAPSTDTTPALSPSDVAVHDRAVEFEQDYESIWHVSQDTAQCVQSWTNATASDKAEQAALKVNPRHTPGGDCTH